ncbi:MAG: TonB-dependent receptor [Flavobacteriales bacterium]|nr:TonB-dependent receptor [Flavobacteriales bacterium]
MRLPLWVVALGLLAAKGASGQGAPDTVMLHSVVIQAPRLSDFTSGIKMQVLDSSTMAHYRTASLGDLLRGESPVFIKNYGPGSLATASFRGSGAGHTAILWNGFNIGSPMNGQVDLSLVPAGIADQVRVQYGGAGALWGSGAVGGAVQLNDQPVFSRGLTVDAGASLGSFGDNRQQMLAEWSGAKWISSISAYRSAARNNFEYRNLELRGSPLERQQNAEFRQNGLVAATHLRINEGQQLHLHYWYQHNDRQVPATLLQAASTAEQRDASHRATAEWQRNGARANSYVRAGWFDDRLDWHGAATDSAAQNRSRTFIAEAEMRLRISSTQRIDLGVNNTWADAISDGYPNRLHQNRTAAFAAYRIGSRDQRSSAMASVRQEMVGGVPVPFTWTVGGEHAIAKVLSVKANASRLYRIPTFNDLYWVPGGDPGLLPESGYGGELGLHAKAGLSGDWAVHTEVTGFQRLMDNWIIWLPSGVYWSPRNLMNVWSRGVEARGGITWKKRRTTVKLDVMTNYVRSTNERAKSANDASVGKQLIYVPMYSGHGRITVGHGHVQASVGTDYTGYRYTSTDNLDFLPPYWLLNATVSCRIAKGRGYTADLLVQGYNLLGESYQVMLGRPMPLQSFNLGLQVHFNRPLRQPLHQE